MSTPVPGTFQQNPNPNGPGSDPAIGDQNPNPNANTVPSPAAFQHGASGEQMFTAAQLEAARKQEKDKLYAQIQGLQEEQRKASEALAAIQKAKDDELAAVQAAEAQKAEEARKKAEEEMSAKALLEQKLAETTQTWQQKFEQMEAERAQEKALLEKEREYQALVSYRNDAIAAAGDDIAPQFFDFIQGDTKEQIDAGIARAKAATESIAQQFQAAQQTQLSQMRGVSTAGYAPVGPMENNPGQQTVSPEQLAGMSMAEYAQFRNKTGVGAAESRSNRGLFG
ncbi:scaffolding protein [Streptomyces phage LuckySocke]|jgi:membrane protein involved in colicin uptake|nr:scaffolding protein [Streptomyces phage Alone3]WPH58991.1 scaffolding protein [Streptomyces phage LuckySocke]